MCGRADGVVCQVRLIAGTATQLPLLVSVGSYSWVSRSWRGEVACSSCSFTAGTADSCIYSWYSAHSKGLLKSKLRPLQYSGRKPNQAHFFLSDCPRSLHSEGNEATEWWRESAAHLSNASTCHTARANHVPGLSFRNCHRTAGTIKIKNHT
jgi:hypothetical protein